MTCDYFIRNILNLNVDIQSSISTINDDLWGEFCVCRSCIVNRTKFIDMQSTLDSAVLRPPFMPVLDCIYNDGDKYSRGKIPKSAHDAQSIHVRLNNPKTPGGDKRYVIATQNDPCLFGYHVYDMVPKVFLPSNVTMVDKNRLDVSVNSLKGLSLVVHFDPVASDFTYHIIPARFIMGGFDWCEDTKNSSGYQYRRKIGNLQWFNLPRLDRYSYVSKEIMMTDDILINNPQTKKVFCGNGNARKFIKWLNRSVTSIEKDDVENESIVLLPYNDQKGDIVWDSNILIDFATQKEVDTDNLTDTVDCCKIVSDDGLDRGVQSIYTSITPDDRYFRRRYVSRFKKYNATKQENQPQLVIHDMIRKSLLKAVDNVRLQESLAKQSDNCYKDLELMRRCFFVLPIDSWRLENKNSILNALLGVDTMGKTNVSKNNKDRDSTNNNADSDEKRGVKRKRVDENIDSNESHPRESDSKESILTRVDRDYIDVSLLGAKKRKIILDMGDKLAVMVAKLLVEFLNCDKDLDNEKMDSS